jgi:multicomponent Na+:H+ antiporter subunit D
MIDVNFTTQSSFDLMLVFSILAPTACGFFSLACGSSNKVRNIGVGILSILHLINVINIKFFFDNNGVFSYKFIGVSKSLNISFITEPYGVIFAIMVSILWVVTNIYSIGYIFTESTSTVNKDTHAMKFNFFVSLAIAATMGVSFSANLLTLYLCYEVLTLVTYPLVNISGSEHSMKAGRKYLIVLTMTSVFFFLPGIIYLYSLIGNFDFINGGSIADKVTINQVMVLLILFVFGTAKTAIMPFHFWLPSAMVAPVPVSALLHSVAVVKTGVFALIKIIVYVLGVDYMLKVSAEHPYVRGWFVYLCMVTIIYASYKAYKASKIKKMLAYSTISQLAYSLLALSMFTHKAIFAGFLHMIVHGFSKIILFFVAGAIYTTTGITEIKEMRSIAYMMPLMFIFFLIGAFSLLGIPPLAGFYSKMMILEQAWRDPMYLEILVVMIVGTIFSMSYFMEFVFVAMRKPTTRERVAIPGSMTIATFSVALFVLLFLLVANGLSIYMENIHY